MTIDNEETTALLRFDAVLKRMNRKLAHEGYKVVTVKTLEEGKVWKLLNRVGDAVRTFCTHQDVVQYAKERLGVLSGDEKVVLVSRFRDADTAVVAR